MNQPDNAAAGFFGKIPSLGDFVSRRLPRNFIDPWDQWLQSGMRSSQELLGDEWLSIYLVSPIWRFALSPGLCGASSWAGVMIPSVDRVGRYYPLTLAQPVNAQQMANLFLPDCGWFAQLEELALSVLEENFDFEAFDQSVSALVMEKYLSRQVFPPSLPGNQGKQGFRYDMDSFEQISSAFTCLNQRLLEKIYPAFSLWAAIDHQQNQSRFLCCEALPPVDAFAGFLRGLPQHPQWNLQVNQLTVDSDQAIDPPNIQNPTESPAITAGNIWLSFGASVVGHVRQHNEDALLVSPANGLWVVADGMGGHRAGDVASQAIVHQLAEIANIDSLDALSEQVCDRLMQINTELCHYAASSYRGGVIGSTVVALLAKNNECNVIWAGDSRLYRFRHGQITQISRDHSLIDEIMQTHNVSRLAASLQAGANVITRAVGGHAELLLEQIRFTAQAGDRYLLCSDGLDKELSETEIAGLMQTGDCQEVADNLINQALAKGGRDNITVIVVEYG